MPESNTRRPRGRWAPSPTGLLHVGNARTALAAWLSVRSRGGTFVWRLEDLDPPRIVPGAAEAAMDDLRWLGLDWDEGPGLPDGGGSYGPYAQSARRTTYEDVLTRLAASERLFPCDRSRKDLQELASAPHGPSGSAPYPARLRPRTLAADWLDAHRRACAAASGSPHAALRFRVDDRPVTFDDRVWGPVTERLPDTVGDFVLQRRDGLYAYQLAVVADDIAMEIDEVVRGEDLLSSTARQIQLLCALGGTVPAYAHVPLVVAEDGAKLSKRDEGLTLRSLRDAGIRPEVLVGWMGASLGLLPEARPCRPAELVDRFDWARVPREPARFRVTIPP